ncbi:hypothetical protein BC628DRAFT_1144806 [Trametes gibbosa]|nr:hypothetical protein BC628DRAFT_1144806 [Trametes gibbosa]
MAKSLRAKTKRLHRAKKRTEGVYAATEAARLHRLHSKLKALTSTVPEADEDEDADADVELAEGEQRRPQAETAAADGESPADAANGPDAMDLDSSAASSSTQRISTHGPRNSRREQWRASKGLVPRPKAKGNGMNRQGGLAARRKAGRSQRRR